MEILRFLSRRGPGKVIRVGNYSDNTKVPKGSVECRVHMLDGTDETFFVPKNEPSQALFDKVFHSLDLLESDYFGLQHTDLHQVQHWLDRTKTIKKQMKVNPPFMLSLHVKFYSLEPQNLRDEATRYLFFLQLKRDIQTGRLACPFDVAVQLAAYVLQSELGDYDTNMHISESISEFRFVPAEEQTDEMEAEILEAYKKLQGKSPAQAEQCYLKTVKSLDKYGVTTHPMIGKDGREYFLAMKPHGLILLEGATIIGDFLWHKIEHFTLNKKTLTIETWDDGNGKREPFTFVFTLWKKEAAKNSWKCAIEHHTFFRLRGAPREPTVTQKFFRLGSRFRYSGKTEMQAVSENRPPKIAQFERRPSQRFSRRASVRRPSTVGSATEAMPAVFPQANSTNVSITTLPRGVGSVTVLASSLISPIVDLSFKRFTPPVQRFGCVSSSSCEVLSSIIFRVDNRHLPSTSRRENHKRSPSLPEIQIAIGKEFVDKSNEYQVDTIDWTAKTPQPLSPAIPMRKFNNERLISSLTSVPFSLLMPPNRKPNPNDVMQEFHVKDALIVSEDKQQIAAKNDFSQDLLRETKGFKFNCIDTSNKSSSDSGRASPSSSPLSYLSRRPIATVTVQGSGDVDICDRTPLLHDSEEDRLPSPPAASFLSEEIAIASTFRNATDSGCYPLTENQPLFCCGDDCGMVGKGKDHPSMSVNCAQMQFESVSLPVCRSDPGSDACRASDDSPEQPIYAVGTTPSYTASPWLAPEVTVQHSSKKNKRRVITTQL